MSKWIRKGDSVIVVAGNNRTTIGKVLARKGDRVVVEGVNVRKKHARRSRQAKGKSEILEYEMPIHISNVRFCMDDKPVRVKVRYGSKGKKELYAIKDGKEVRLRGVGEK